MILYCDTSVDRMVISLIINSGSSEIGEMRVLINIVITDITSHNAIIRNNWLSKINVKINYTNSEISLV
ncbi:13687_t:CDS:2 [Cetraspora pellucida]|uniref:13687_t:CDS:1 n=1 Tax=Cetraspora pellucida TaxID=1433469 RepID=A0A9N9H822_9GLOM|nr:13687_t:CDS:2 [Cetraspora pellucida]